MILSSVNEYNDKLLLEMNVIEYQAFRKLNECVGYLAGSLFSFLSFNCYTLHGILSFINGCISC